MYVKINCYNNDNWPNENKFEIDRAIKKCLEVFVLFYLFSHFRNSFFKKFFINFFTKKIAINNKELKEILNEKYKKIKKIGSGAQGTVYEIEDLSEDRKK